MELLEKQRVAYELATIQKKNLFITGPAGVGKGFVIKKIHDHFCSVIEDPLELAITAMTGIAALLINGTTLHSYLKIGLGKGDVISIIKTIHKNKQNAERWTQLKVLIIDEISMLSPELFDKLEKVARIMKNTNKPFGGIQLILSGDFCQLPCVDSNGQFCFEAEKWNTCVDEVVCLNEIVRQTNIEFKQFLNDVRLGDVNEEYVKKFVCKSSNNFRTTKIFAYNRDVDRTNTRFLNELLDNGEKLHEYKMKCKIKNNKKVKNDFSKYSNFQENLELCVGAQVMLLINIHDLNLANGSKGIITSFNHDGYPIVDFNDPCKAFVSELSEVTIEPYVLNVEEQNVVVMTITQIPLRLAYAISIHKSQGLTLDKAEINLFNLFEYGQAYVALSRVTNPDGLVITNFSLDSIKAHPKAIEFYTKLT